MPVALGRRVPQPEVQFTRRVIMKANVGTIDRVLRIVAGLVLVGLAASGTIGMWGYIGVVPLLTGLFRFCPVYPLIGLNTCPMEKR
jgi:hypothetical protein